jgi:hypothetical protein
MRHRSARKYRRTAAIVPSCTTAVKAVPGSSQPSMAGTIRRWPLDEIGRNSVRPWTSPRTIASSVDIGPASYGAQVQFGLCT